MSDGINDAQRDHDKYKKIEEWLHAILRCATANMDFHERKMEAEKIAAEIDSMPRGLLTGQSHSFFRNKTKELTKAIAYIDSRASKKILIDHANNIQHGALRRAFLAALKLETEHD